MPTTLLSVGDRVVLDPSNEDNYKYGLENVGEYNIGTITGICYHPESVYYVIEWDNKGPYTYEDFPNINQYNLGGSLVKLALNYTRPTIKELVCKKILQLEQKFKDRKLKYDF